MNSIFFSPKYEAHGNKIFGLVKNKFPEESTRLLHTVPALKAGLKRVHSTGVVIVILDGEDELVELALKPGIPQNLAIVVVLPDRNEELLRVAGALSPALIWFDDNSVDDLMLIISRIKLEQNIRREELENLELSWSDDWQVILERHGIQYVFYGPNEQALSKFAPTSAPYLKSVFQSGRVTIFQVVSVP